MKLNVAEREIKQQILNYAQNNVKAITPGLKVQAYLSGRKKVDLALGETARYYDLASLTKVLFTNSAFINLSDQKILNVKDRVSDYATWWPHQDTRIHKVLAHNAGLDWWAPFYKKLNLKLSVESRREQARKILLNSAVMKRDKALYSDLDYILLGFVLEGATHKKLLQVWEDLPLRDRLKGLHFNFNNKPLHKRSVYAPTEKCPWRKKILRGEVHDDNTWSFGGVSTHAGLFGTIDDVSAYGLLLRDGLRGRNNVLGRSSTIRMFCKRQMSVRRGDWAMGFMMPTAGGASCGQYFSAQSVGHTGFTGTSLWYDPKRDLLVTIVSNRVHPTRKNRQFIALRPKIHDFIVEALD